MIEGTKYLDSLEELFTLQDTADFYGNRLDSIYFRFLLQNLWRLDQTGTFFFRIYASAFMSDNKTTNRYQNFPDCLLSRKITSCLKIAKRSQ